MQTTGGNRSALVAGASGYIGRAVVRELTARGFRTVALLRREPTDPLTRKALAGSELRLCEVCDAGSLREQGFRGERFHAVISCLASRSGAPADAWRVDHGANRNLLQGARDSGSDHFILLSAICVQKPRLEFQRAKLAFERELQDAGLRYSIVRPTAFFKSLAGQVNRVKNGRPFLVFGDGRLTACKPISEADLARFLVDCIDDTSRHDRILPVGGPGPALTPREQGAMLCELAGQPLRYRQVPVKLMDAIIAATGALGRLFRPLRDKAEFARIGRYYATESMLVWDEERQRYDADATPEFGADTLRDFYRRVLEDGLQGQELGEHAVFERGGEGRIRP